MSKSEVIFLDKIPEAVHLPHFTTSTELLYVAATLAGIEDYKKLNAKNPGALCLWIKNQESLEQLKGPGEKLNAQFLFSYHGLKPSGIARHGSFRGPESTELPDPRIQDFSLITPEARILQKAKISSPEISVIIPVFENDERASKALRSWFAQDHTNYEIVMVDDGSRHAWMHRLVGQFPDRLTLLQLSRSKIRHRGDHHFRAGLARNVGLQNSRGEKIIFCDSDIIVSPEMARQASSRLNSADIVMPMRWQLNEASSKAFTTYQNISFQQDVILSPGAFWESFQMQELPWQETPNYWKWTSTFCLSTHRHLLTELGGFKKSFVTYGFEDTELGYRFHRHGKRFDILPLNTYHLFQPPTHSEYGNDLQKKKALLRISAERFFRHHPVKEVYAALQNWLD